jgi:eukaryotic-like serine/threonine-protein kinase
VESPVSLSPCPDAHELAELAHGRLPPRAAEALRGHLDECELCRVAVTRLVAPSSDRAPALPVGVEVGGRYRVSCLLGRGGMGEVHEAWDLNLERRVAVKVLLPRGQDREDIERRIARLVRESKAMARLRHPNVVAVYDAGSWEGHAFVVMELVDGQTLRSWLVRSRRAWADVVAMFAGAGHGLAAAHAVGIVHRDFKPDNVLVDEHDRPQVTDFGLARLVDDTMAWSGRNPAAPPELPDASAIEWTGVIEFDASGSLTQTGAAVGTPAYMAPEQFRGQAVDARADVFGFCVALYEGLVGRRPFVADTPRAILEAQWRGPATKPLDEAGVPRFVRDAIVAGLQVDPRARPASMNALLQRLQPRPRRRRWLAVAMVGIAVVGAAGALAYARTRAPDPCALGEEPWDDARRRRIAAAHAHDPQPWTHAERGIDRFATEWNAEWSSVCRVRNADVDTELRRACLLGQRRAFTAVMAGLDAGTIDLDAAVAGIPRTRECSGERDLATSIPVPDDPEAAREVEAIRTELAEIDGLLEAGQARELGGRVDALLERARATGFRPIEAEVSFSRAIVQDQLGDHRAARTTMMEAANAASAGGHDVMAANAWIWLVEVDGQDLLDFERGREAAAQARAAIERVGASPEAEVLTTHLRYQIGVLAWRSGNATEALEELQAARRMAETHAPELVDQTLEGIGLVLDDLGRSDEALAIHRELKERRIAQHGADHPVVATSYANIAAVHLQRGELDEALASVDDQLRVTAAAAGEEHPDYGLALHNRGVILHGLARWDEALEDLRGAARIFTAAFGAESSQVAVAIEHEAGVLQSMGRFDEALVLMRRALDIHRHQQLWKDSARCEMNLADLLRESGHPDDALVPARNAAAAFEEHAPGIPEHAYALTVLGEVELVLGRPGNATVQLERAVEMFDRGAWLPEEAALARFLLARALVASGGDRERARTLAEGAVERWNAAPPSWEPRLRIARTWLALQE